MIVECARCNRRYDDAERWTICPHNPLEYSASALYCSYHDAFNCPHPHNALHIPPEIRNAVRDRLAGPTPKSNAAAKCLLVLSLVALLDLALWCVWTHQPWPALVAGAAYAVFAFMRFDGGGNTGMGKP